MDQSGRLLRRILFIISTDPPQAPTDQSTVQLPTKTLVELTQPPPATYTIYVDGGWDTVKMQTSPPHSRNNVTPPTAEAQQELQLSLQALTG